MAIETIDDRWFNVRRRGAFWNVYDLSFLERKLLPAITRESSDDLTEIQLQAFRSAFPSTAFEAITCSFETADHEGKLDQITEFNKKELAQEYLEARKNAPELDFSWVARSEQPGRPLFASDFMSRPEFEDSLLYNTCIAPLNMSEVFCISYCDPRRNEAMKITQRFILSSGSADMGPTRQHDVEYLNVPFVLSWMCRAKMISVQALKRYFKLISGISPMQMAILREVVNSHSYSAVNVSAKYRISKRTLETHIRDIYEYIRYSMGIDQSDTQRSSRIVDLVNHYSFLSFCAPVQNEYNFKAALQKAVIATQDRFDRF